MSKDPDDRPTAHDLLGRLLTKEPAGVAHLADKPQLRWAALAVRNNGPTLLGADQVADVWSWVARRRRTRTLLRKAAVGAALAAALAGIAAAPPVRDLAAALTSTGSPATGQTVQPPSPLATITLADPLRKPGPWHALATTDDGGDGGGCRFHNDGLFIYRMRSPAFQCPGPRRAFSNPTVAVTISGTIAGTPPGADCGAIWLRAGPNGSYRVAICPGRLTLDVEPPRRRATTIADAAIPGQPSRSDSHRIKITANGPYIDVAVDGTPRLHETITRPQLRTGKLILGIIRNDQTTSATATGQSVTFSDIQVWEP